MSSACEEQQLILSRVDAGIGTVTLNRPSESNAMTQPLWGAILRVLQQFAADDAVRVIVITGAGPAFCAGADISRLRKWASGDEADLPLTRPSPAIARKLDLPPGFDDRFSYFAQIPKPVLAAINGAAVGSGFALAMYSDIRFATPNAKLSVGFGKLGLIGEMALPWILSRITAPHIAADLLFSSRVVTGSEAAQLGIINRTFPEEQFLQSVHDYAREIVTTGTLWALGKMKQQLYRGLMQSLDEAMREYYPIMRESLRREEFAARLSSMLAGLNKGRK